MEGSKSGNSQLSQKVRCTKRRRMKSKCYEHEKKTEGVKLVWFIGTHMAAITPRITIFALLRPKHNTFV